MVPISIHIQFFQWWSVHIDIMEDGTNFNNNIYENSKNIMCNINLWLDL